MDFEKLDIFAKQLAPVFKQVMTEALANQKSELESKYQAEIDTLVKRFDELDEKQVDLSGLATESFVKEFQAAAIEDLRVIAKEEAEEFQKTALEAIPTPKDGADGKDGKSVTLEDVRPLIEELVSQIPAPENGKDGADGKSIELEHVKPLIEELVKSVVAEIPAPTNGKDGQSVKIEDVLPEIKAEIERRVAAIPAAEKGVDGIDGKDAAQIEILPSVDLDKSYPRGTYAIHDGGLVRSYQQTQREKGWEPVARGVSGIDIELKDARTIVVKTRLTMSGEEVKEFSIPSMIYKDVWTEGAYSKGDVVTWGGSLWHSNEDNNEEKPGTVSGQEKKWTLAAKKGRDLRDPR